MFDPVWLGNYIVPRWEAIALVIGGFTACVIVVVVLISIPFWLADISKWRGPR